MMKEKEQRPVTQRLMITALSVLLLMQWPEMVSAQIQPIPFDKIGIITTKLTPRFYTLTATANVDPGHPEGAGGRMGVLIGKKGVFLVDCSYSPLAGKILDAIKLISNGPVRFLVNTHEHPDHTGGNPNFARQGAVLIARQEVRDALLQPLPPAIAAVIGNAASNDDPDRLPVLTYDGKSTVRIYFDDDIIDLIPVINAHTNGDTMIKFEQEDVIMIGDFYRNYGYPFVDPAHGGSFRGVIAAIDTLLTIAGPDTQLVPGHGTIINRAALIPYRDMILDIRSHVLALIAAGKSREEVLAAKLTASYDTRVPGGTQPLPAGLGTSADRFVRTLYDECKKQSL
jgi:glyoxylase-like metal-dependent hydrolase (beta-lactamase superfamily II)